MQLPGAGVVVAQLRDHAVKCVGQVNAAAGWVFLSAGVEGNAGDGFIEFEACEQAVAEMAVGETPALRGDFGAGGAAAAQDSLNHPFRAVVKVLQAVVAGVGGAVNAIETGAAYAGNHWASG